MIVKRLLLINKEQHGVTLIELLVVIVVTGVILPATVTGVYLIHTQSNISNNRLAAINSVQNAGEWVIKDTRMARTVTPTSGNFPLNLTWTGYPAGTSSVIYSVANNELSRLATINGTPTTTVVARFIDSSGTNCTFQNNTLIFNITSKVPTTGANQVTETRTFQASPRTQ
jgi:prepilin-type N-terminal cleavage/methylation domain-containing protein